MYRICRKSLGQELWLKYPCFRAVWRAGPEASPRGRGWTACGWGRWRARRGWWGSSTTSSSTSTWWAGTGEVVFVTSRSHLSRSSGSCPRSWWRTWRRCSCCLTRTRTAYSPSTSSSRRDRWRQSSRKVFYDTTNTFNALIVSNIWHPWEAYCLYWHSVGAGDAVAGPEAGHGRPAADGQVRAGQHRRYTQYSYFETKRGQRGSHLWHHRVQWGKQSNSFIALLAFLWLFLLKMCFYHLYCLSIYILEKHWLKLKWLQMHC